MNFSVILLAIAAIVLIATAVIAWPRRHSTHWVLPFLGLALAISIWLIGYALELSIDTFEGKLFWAQTEYIGIAFTPITWFLFAYQFLHQDSRQAKSWVPLLSIIPIITIIVAFTNSRHYMLWSQVALDQSGQQAVLSVSYGGWFWIHSAYSYLFILGGIVLFLRALKLHQGQYRWQSGLLILAAAAPLSGNALYLAGLSPIPNFDLTPFAFAISALLITWGVIRLDLFDIVPIARRAIVESLPDGIILLDMENRILDINEMGRKLMGSDEQTIVGKYLQELDSEIAQKCVLHSNQMEVIDEPIEIKSGGVRWYNVRLRPFYTSGSNPRARILILRDVSLRIAAESGIRQRNKELQQLITETQKAREEAEIANKAKSELLAKVSHELRTPLGAILGHAEMLQEGVYGNILEDQQHQALGRIIENSGYLNEQVEDLLDLSRIGSGTMEIELYEFSLEDALDQVHDRLKSVADNKNIGFIIQTSPDMPETIMGNAIRFQQILLNLCSNAIKFTNKGQVCVDIFPTNQGNYSIVVEDSGKGIPQAELQSIFQPFYQLDATLVRGQGGVGLGLSIVQEIVQALGGTIQVESELNKGSKFTITFPLNLKIREKSYARDKRQSVNY
jgi:PAS domain S-box-containing protein